MNDEKATLSEGCQLALVQADISYNATARNMCDDLGFTGDNWLTDLIGIVLDCRGFHLPENADWQWDREQKPEWRENFYWLDDLTDDSMEGAMKFLSFVDEEFALYRQGREVEPVVRLKREQALVKVLQEQFQRDEYLRKLERWAIKIAVPKLRVLPIVAKELGCDVETLEEDLVEKDESGDDSDGRIQIPIYRAKFTELVTGGTTQECLAYIEYLKATK